LPFRSSGSTGSLSTAPTHKLEGRLADQYLVRQGRLLQPGGHVDRVAGSKPLLALGNHLTGVDADPALHPELGERRQHLRRGPAGAQRVVLMQPGHTEHGHHRVADELLDSALVRLDDRLHPLEVAGE
jgi:hypothetical protein